MRTFDNKGEVTNNKIGADMLEFLTLEEVKTLSGRVQKAGHNGQRQCMRKGDNSILDFMLVAITGDPS